MLIALQMYGEKKLPAKFLTGNFQKNAAKHVFGRVKTD
jgi:hypothetical protein